MAFNKPSLNVSKIKNIRCYEILVCVFLMTTIFLAQALPDKKIKKMTTQEKEIEKHKRAMNAINKKDSEAYLRAWHSMSLTKYLHARRVFEHLAKKGLAYGQHDLGLLYENGFGVKRDLKKALYWYEKAAKQGFEKTMFHIQEMYLKGDKSIRDPKKAKYWDEKIIKMIQKNYPDL